MPSLKIIMKNRPNKVGKNPLYVRYIFDQKDLLYATGERVAPKHWNPKRNEVRKTYGRGYGAMNDKLKNKIDDIDKIRLELEKHDIEPTVDAVRAKLDEVLGKKKAQKRGFFDLWDQYIEEKRPHVGEYAIKHYKTCKMHLFNFQEATGYKLTLSSINDRFYNKFLDYLFNYEDEKIKKKPLGKNTVGMEVKELKTFLNFLTDKGIYDKKDYKRFKKPNAPTDIIYLTEREIAKLAGLRLKKRPALDRARDLFLLGVYTGLRYSDFSQIRKENIQDNFFYIHTRKTDKPMKIPMIRAAKALLEKYDYGLPTITNQRLNDHLKEIGRIAKITDPVEVVRYSQNTEERTSVAKCELITTHTARRTFITQSLERGMRPETIMKITGHTNIKTLMRYVRITEKVVEMEMLRAWDQPIMKVS